MNKYGFMTITNEIMKTVGEKHLLKHPFYQDWSEGKLTKEELKDYSAQYYHHVDAFPRYISATHSLCEDIKSRQFLLENLNDEESGDKHHPELWLQFAEGMGASREEVKQAELLPETKNLIETFFKLSRSSYAEGLGALFAYEQQVPEVAASKIDGLKKFYGIQDERTLEFFNVHLKADVYHSQTCAELLESLSPEEQTRARNAAESASSVLWGFLDGIQRTRKAA